MKIVTIEHTELAYYADFGAYLLMLLLLPGVLLHYTPTAMRWALPVAALAGLVMWTLIEYAMHRLVFHGLEPFRSMHAQHHQRPLALIATPTIVSLALIAVLVWLPATLLVGLWLGSGVTLGVTMGYFAYGVVHHGVHHWRANNAWLRQRKRQHAIHHHHSQVNYGVTTLWWDRVFGSCKPPLDHQE